MLQIFLFSGFVLTDGEPLRHENKKVMKVFAEHSDKFPLAILSNGIFARTQQNAIDWMNFLKDNGFDLNKNNICNPIKDKSNKGWHFEQNVFDETGISRSLKASEGSGNRLKIIKPTLTPNRAKKRQKGRRMKEDGEPMFTLTGQDVHGVTIIDKKGNPKIKTCLNLNRWRT